MAFDMTCPDKRLQPLAELPEGAAVYQIRQLSTGRIYIGSSERARRRIYEHQRYLASNSHCNAFLQRTWNLSEPGDFVVEIVAAWQNAQDAREHERRLIVDRDACNPAVGFNLMVPAEGGAFRHSDETRAKLSAALVGHKRNVGKPLSAEHKAKISAAQKGRAKPADQVERAAAARRGKPASPESVAKRSASLKGKRRTNEQRRQMSAAAKDRGTPVWMIEAARAANTGRKASPESIAARLEGKRKAKALREQGA